MSLECTSSASLVKGVKGMGLSYGPVRHRASTAAVLDFAWDAGVFRADHVMAALDLTRSTALAALDSLIELGVVSEVAGPEDDNGYRLGRPARRFALTISHHSPFVPLRQTSTPPHHSQAVPQIGHEPTISPTC